MIRQTLADAVHEMKNNFVYTPQANQPSATHPRRYLVRAVAFLMLSLAGAIWITGIAIMVIAARQGEDSTASVFSTVKQILTAASVITSIALMSLLACIGDSEVVPPPEPGELP